ncbi:MAG: hypothetical protein HY319_22295 [Armatimonadetes bacterium]|nr:hypothetical protein [Armatimonadota bacterium]
MAFVLILLVVDGALLAIVKLGAPKDENKIVDIEAFVANEETAKKVESQLAGQKVTISKDMREKVVPHGWIVLKHMGEPELAQPIADTLIRKGRKDAKVVGDAVLVGGIFDSEAKAKQVAAKLEQQESIKFDIEQGEKKVTSEVYKLVVEGLDSQGADKVKEVLGQNQVEDYESKPAAQ